MPKIYVVVESDFEYNDEIYRQNDGSNPVKAFRKEENAEKLCFEKNCEFVENNDLGSYGYGADDVFSDEQRILELTGVDADEDFYDSNYSSAFRDLSEEEKREFLRLLKIVPFKVVEVEVS